MVIRKTKVKTVCSVEDTHTITYTHTYKHIHTNTHTHTYVHIVCTPAWRVRIKRTHTRTRTPAHTHAHTRTHTYTCTRTHRPSLRIQTSQRGRSLFRTWINDFSTIFYSSLSSTAVASWLMTQSCLDWVFLGWGLILCSDNCNKCGFKVSNVLRAGPGIIGWNQLLLN